MATGSRSDAHHADTGERLREARGIHPLAPELINLLAFFAPRPIPVELLARQVHRVPGRLSTREAAPERIVEVLEALAECGVLRGGEGSVRMPEALQRAVRRDLVRPQAAGYADASLRILEGSVEELEDGGQGQLERRRRLVVLPHAPSVARRLVELGRAPDRALVLGARAVEAVGADEESDPLAAASSMVETARDSDRLRDPFLLAALLDQLGELQAARGNEEGAWRCLGEAVEVAEEVCPEEDPRRAVVLHNAGDLARRLGGPEEATALLERCLELLGHREGPRDALRCRASLDLAEARLAAGRADPAAEAARTAVVVCRRHLGAEHPETAAGWSLWGRSLRQADRPAAAAACFRRAVAALEETYGGEHPALGADLGNLAEALEDQGDRETARAQHRRAARIFLGAYGEDHDLTRAAVARLRDA